jgi:hypothetical protein
MNRLLQTLPSSLNNLNSVEGTYVNPVQFPTAPLLTYSFGLTIWFFDR